VKYYRLRSEAYSSRSEIFVNGRDCRPEAGPYPIERECSWPRGVAQGRGPASISTAAVVEKLRMTVDIAAESRSDGIH
jgi:hypothetical protein